MSADPVARIFRFGVFEANAATGELRKSGTRVRVQEQAFRVLMLLMQRPGQLVSREDLRRELWPADTFVDFDHSLNTLINKLREALGDSAANPRFIETLAKRGYRFLPAVEATGDGAAAKPPIAIDPALAATAPTLPVESKQTTSLLTSAHELPRMRVSYVRALLLLIQVMYLSFYLAALARLPVVEELLDRYLGGSRILNVILIVSAAIGIPIRFYLISYVAFDVKGLSQRFLRIFLGVLVLDELWALAPFLLAPQIGFGFALAVTAALTYLPFAQRTLVLMRDRDPAAA